MQYPLLRSAADPASVKHPSPPHYREIPGHELIFDRDENGKKIKIGEGGFGFVYKGYCTLPGFGTVAIKRGRRCEYGTSERDVRDLKREAASLHKIRHPDIVTMYGITIDDTYVEDQLYCLIMEYMEMGSLDELLEKVEIPWEVKAKMLEGVSRGLAYALNVDNYRGDNMVHGDINARNILVDGFFRAKITDMGLTKIQDITSRTTNLYSKGTLTHAAPELLDFLLDEDGDYDPAPTEKSDVYAFGVTMFQVLAEKKPPKDSPEYGHPKYRCPFPVKMTKNKMRKFLNRKMDPIFTPEQRNKIPDDCPRFLIKIMEKCCEVDRDNRPTFIEITQELANSFESSGLKRTYYSAMSKLYETYQKQIPDEAEFQSNQDQADHDSRTYDGSEYLIPPRRLRNLKGVKVTKEDWKDLENDVAKLLQIASERSVSPKELEEEQENLNMQLKYFYCENTPVTLEDMKEMVNRLKNVTTVLLSIEYAWKKHYEFYEYRSKYKNPLIRNNYIYFRYNMHPNRQEIIDYLRDKGVLNKRHHIYCSMKRDEVEKINVILHGINDLMPEGLGILADCLENAGFPDVAENMRKGHIMERLHNYEVKNLLIYNMKPRDVIEKLFTACYLNESDRELIDDEPRTAYKIRVLIDAIDREGPPALEELIKILHETNQTMLAKQLTYVHPEQ